MKQLLILLIIASLGCCYSDVLNAQICFSPRVNARVDIDPVAICTADFNGDNKPDIAVAYKGASHITVFLNNGLAGFTNRAHFSIGAVPTFICTGDFNGDGKIDLVTSNAGPGTVMVFPGNGDGTFDTVNSQTYSTLIFGASAMLCTADFSGDSKPDLLVSSGNNWIWKGLGDGNGGFATYRRVVADNGTHCLTSGDFNGDGKPDIAVTTFNISSHVSVLLNRGTDSFSAATNFSIGDSPASLITADFNNDGKPDLATANAAGTVSVLLGNGAGSFGAATTVTTGTSTIPRFMCTADFNGDGNKDLAIACIVNNNASNVTILPGNGSGGFGPAVTFATDSFANGLVAADLNADGKPDLMQSASLSNIDSGRLSVLLNCAATDVRSIAPGQAVSVYPNPGSGIFHISAATEITRITIVNMLGDVIYASPVYTSKSEFDLSGQASGVYFYLLETKGGVGERGKIVVK